MAARMGDGMLKNAAPGLLLLPPPPPPLLLLLPMGMYVAIALGGLLLGAPTADMAAEA